MTHQVTNTIEILKRMKYGNVFDDDQFVRVLDVYLSDTHSFLQENRKTSGDIFSGFQTEVNHMISLAPDRLDVPKFEFTLDGGDYNDQLVETFTPLEAKYTGKLVPAEYLYRAMFLAYKFLMRQQLHQEYYDAYLKSINHGFEKYAGELLKKNGSSHSPAPVEDEFDEDSDLAIEGDSLDPEQLKEELMRDFEGKLKELREHQAESTRSILKTLEQLKKQSKPEPVKKAKPEEDDEAGEGSDEEDFFGKKGA